MNDVAPGATVRSLTALFWRTNPVPESPTMAPPMVYVVVTQVTAMLATAAAATVPVPFATVQV